MTAYLYKNKAAWESIFGDSDSCFLFCFGRNRFVTVIAGLTRNPHVVSGDSDFRQNDVVISQFYSAQNINNKMFIFGAKYRCIRKKKRNNKKPIK
jgi:hypothetical protein